MNERAKLTRKEGERGGEEKRVSRVDEAHSFEKRCLSVHKSNWQNEGTNGGVRATG